MRSEGRYTALPVAVARERAELRAVVARGDPPDGARAAAHDQRLGRRAPRALVAHAAQHVAVGDPGGGEEGVVALDQVVLGHDLGDVVAGRLSALALVVVARPQAADQ